MEVFDVFLYSVHPVRLEINPTLYYSLSFYSMVALQKTKRLFNASYDIPRSSTTVDSSISSHMTKGVYVMQDSSFSHSLSLSHTLSLSLSFSLTHSLSLSLTHTHTHTLSLSVSNLSIEFTSLHVYSASVKIMCAAEITISEFQRKNEAYHEGGIIRFMIQAQNTCYRTLFFILRY